MPNQYVVVIEGLPDYYGQSEAEPRYRHGADPLIKLGQEALQHHKLTQSYSNEPLSRQRVVIHAVTAAKGQQTRTQVAEYQIPLPRDRMTEAEYKEAGQKLLSDLPVEFHGALSYLAYERGHSAGHEEVLSELSDLVGAIREPVIAYGRRLLKQPKF